MAKYYYNGVLLPEIPTDVLAEYPYAVIVKFLQDGGYRLYAGSKKTYFVVDKGINKLVIPESSRCRYDYNGNNWDFANTYNTATYFDMSNFELIWSNHDIPNGSATSSTVYFCGSEPVLENEVKPKELEYAVFTNFFPSGSTIIYAASELTINYTIPVKKYSTYTVTMTEVGSRLRACYSSIDPATIKANTGATSITEPSSFQVGYTFTYFAKKDGWMVVYVSNSGERPKIRIVTNGVGGDGAQIYGRKYLIRSNSVIYTVENGALSALTETDVTASLFQTYGVDEIPDGVLLATLTDPEVLFWQDSEEELPALTMTVTGAPPLPQVITSGSIDLTHASITGIDHAEVDASEDVRFAISFDDGASWKAFDGSSWFDVSDTAPGMLPSTMNAITTAQWAEVATLTSCLVRAWIPAVTSNVGSVSIHYINP